MASSSAVLSSTLEDLRSLMKSAEKSTFRERHLFASTPSGIPRGALIEIVGPGKTETVVQFLAENSNLRVAWIEDQFTVYPLAFMQRKVSLRRSLFIEAHHEIFWAASQVLRSGLFEVVVMSFQNQLSEKVMRRLQLEAEKANASCFLLPEGNALNSPSSTSWPISMKLKVDLNPTNLTSRKICILRERG